MITTSKDEDNNDVYSGSGYDDQSYDTEYTPKKITAYSSKSLNTLVTQ